jgi:hypothetical protein
MKNALPLALALLLATPLVAPINAWADDDPDAVIHTTAMTTATDACKAIAAALEDVGGLERTCKKLAKKKVKGLGTATAYSLVGDGATSYVLVVTAPDGSLHLSPSLDFNEDSAMGGKEILIKKLTPKVRAIKVGGRPAAALDVDGKMSYERTDIDTGKHASSTPFHQHGFVACGTTAAGAWTCASATLGTAENPCTASLANDGELTYACSLTESLSLGQ